MKATDVVQPTAMATPIALNGSKDTIPQNQADASNPWFCSIEKGFPDITMSAVKDGGKPPRGQGINGLFYLVSDQKVYLQHGGIITFNQTVSNLIGGYPAGAILDYYTSSNKAFTKVVSLIDDNTNDFVTTPSLIDGVHWDYAYFGGANQSLSNLDATGNAKFTAKANDNAVVHLTGNETIAGNKTVLEAITKKGDWDSTQTPAELNVSDGFKFVDSNDVLYGLVTSTIDENNVLNTLLDCRKGNVYSQVRACVDSNNDVYALAPASDKTNSIVTTLGINKSANGYVKLGNGIIIQWGATSGSSNTVTLPVAFTTEYEITMTEWTGGSGVSEPRSVGVSHKTATTFSWSSARQSGQEGTAYNTTWMWMAVGY